MRARAAEVAYDGLALTDQCDGLHAHVRERRHLLPSGLRDLRRVQLIDRIEIAPVDDLSDRASNQPPVVLDGHRHRLR